MVEELLIKLKINIVVCLIYISNKMSTLRLNNSSDLTVNSIRLPVNGGLVKIIDYLRAGVT